MSEWKWCLDCGHHYAAHMVPDGDELGPCSRCDCERFYQEIANFL